MDHTSIVDQVTREALQLSGPEQVAYACRRAIQLARMADATMAPEVVGYVPREDPADAGDRSHRLPHCMGPASAGPGGGGMRANPSATSADQARELGLKVGDTIQGREEVGNYWHVARITLIWIGATTTVWIVSSRSSGAKEAAAWSRPREVTNWNPCYRNWERIETPPEHVALLPNPVKFRLEWRADAVAQVRAADAAISPEALRDEFVAWWLRQPFDRWMSDPVASHLAWARHLLGRGVEG